MDASEAEVMVWQHTGLQKHKIIETNSEEGAQTTMDSSQMKKRKDKDEEIQIMEDDPCGICLAEGVNSRGKLNCCDHYFCFQCIFEWSKVENSCPTCRQRFITIFKMGHSSKVWIYRVPLRDQVHVPTNEDIGAQDPYADLHCIECNGGDDENLLLLCDLCDSAAHTYCVGLGRIVPTGEWYCRECESSNNVNSDTEGDEDEDYVPEFHNKCTSSSSRSMTEASSTAETVATFNQRDVLSTPLMPKNASNTPSLKKTPKRLIHRQVQRPSNAARAFNNPPRASITVAQVSGPSNPPPASITGAQVSRPTSVVRSGGARTLSDRRLLQERVQAMRQNWESLQQGELQFSSRTLSVSNRIIDRTNTGTQFAYKNCLNENRPRLDSQTDIDQAWVLMERAKSLGAKDLGFDGCQEVARSHKADKSQVVSSSRIDKRLLPFSSRNLSVSNRIVDRANAGIKSAYKSYLNENRQRIDSQTDINQAWVLMEHAKSLGSKDLGFDDHQEAARSHKAEKSHLLSSSLFYKQLLEARPPTSSRPVERTAVDSIVGRTSIGQQSNPVLKDRLSSGGLTLQPSSECSATSSKMHTFQTGDCEKTKGSNHAQATTIHKEEYAERLSINLSGRSNKTEASAKDEIMSLVKTHLMPIYKAKRLGICRFKEIARMATHTILAACALEHSEKMVQHFQKTICCHSEKQKLSPSVMCMCCNECFGVFVKDVVTSIVQKQLRN